MKRRPPHRERHRKSGRASPLQRVSNSRPSRARWPVIVVLVAAGILAGLAHQSGAWKGGGSSLTSEVQSDAPAPRSLAELMALSPEQLARCDIALVNLLCAEGLPGSDKGGAIAEHLATLGRMAEHVRRETDRHWYRFLQNPEEYHHSEAYFRMLFLVCVLQEDFGCRYNPERIRPEGAPFEPDEVFYADSRDVFIHGLLGEKRGGTCSSMPVFYAAVGRRLGYPLKLATAKGHLFVRWEGAKETFNIEGTNLGLNRYPDEFYRKWPFAMTPEDEQREGHLRGLPPERELQVFLTIRSMCLAAAGRVEEAIACQQFCAKLHPSSLGPPTLIAAFQRGQPRPPEPRMIPSLVGAADDPALRSRMELMQIEALRGRSSPSAEAAIVAELMSRRKQNPFPQSMPMAAPNPHSHPILPITHDPTPEPPRVP
jgi:hypothetical protein